MYLKLHLLHFFVLDEGLKLGATRDSHVESLGCEERLQVKQVVVVVINQVCEQLIGQSIQDWHDGQGQVPLSVGCTIHVSESGQTF